MPKLISWELSLPSVAGGALDPSLYDEAAQSTHSLLRWMLSGRWSVWAGNHAGWGENCSKVFCKAAVLRQRTDGHESSYFPLHQNVYL